MLMSRARGTYGCYELLVVTIEHLQFHDHACIENNSKCFFIRVLLTRSLTLSLLD